MQADNTMKNNQHSATRDDMKANYCFHCLKCKRQNKNNELHSVPKAFFSIKINLGFLLPPRTNMKVITCK